LLQDSFQGIITGLSDAEHFLENEALSIAARVGITFSEPLSIAARVGITFSERISYRMQCVGFL